MMVQCSLFCVFFYQLLEKKSNNNQTNHHKGSGAPNLGKKNKQNKINGPYNDCTYTKILFHLCYGL